MKAVRFILETFHKFPGRFAGGALLLAVEGVIGAIAVVTVAPVIDLFLSSDPQRVSPITVRMGAMLRAVGLPASLGSFLAVFLGLQVLKNGFAIGVRYGLVRIRYTVLRDLMIGTFDDFFRARWLFFLANRQGTLLNTMLHEMDIVGGALGVMTLFFANGMQLLFYLTVPFYLSWQVTALSLGTAVALAVPFLMLGRLNYRLGRIVTATTNRISAVVQEGFGMAKVILGFGQARRSVRELERAFDVHRRAKQHFLTLQAATPLVYEPFGILVLVVTVVAGRRFGVPLSELAVLLWALRNCMPLLGSLTMLKNSLLHFVPSYEQITALREQARALQQPSGGRPFTGFRQGIAIERLTFAYPDHAPVLVDVTLEIPKGKMVALVGESGAGKSTLIDLLMGFHKPTSGRITIDGIPLHDVDITSYRARVGYVPQESVLFNATIRENLRWADETATDEEIAQACRRANAHEFIERFPDRYDTVVGERGVRLSGGQCQRIALARAILRQPDLLILDEATSALDTQSERLIQQAIETVVKETTVVVIAHRFSTIVNADAIYVLHQGRVAETGTYQELVHREGLFSRMTQMQVLETV